MLQSCQAFRRIARDDKRLISVELLLLLFFTFSAQQLAIMPFLGNKKLLAVYKDVSKFLGNLTPIGESGDLFAAVCAKSRQLTKLAKKGAIKEAA